MHKGLSAVFLAINLILVEAALAHGEAAHARSAMTSREQLPWGIAGDLRRVDRTIVIRATDAMRFHPNRIRVRLNETIRFVIHNEGHMLHEMVLGTQTVLNEHAALMRKFPDMAHDEPYMAHVAPGKSGEIVWRFNRAGEFAYACLIPGHYEAGMVGRIEVRP